MIVRVGLRHVPSASEKEKAEERKRQEKYEIALRIYRQKIVNRDIASGKLAPGTKVEDLRWD
jgi:hypothetical protein